MESLSAPVAVPVVRPTTVVLRLASDARLARLAASGSEGAMAAIFERHHQALYRYCHSIVGNSHDAADALQNTMIRALRALPGEKRDIVLRPWLYRIAHNESISLLRARRPESDLDAAAHLSDLAATGAVESRERMRSLTEDLGELTERQRGALLMRELGGLEFAEVADALDSTAAAAKQSVYEARRSLQDMQAGRDMSCETVRRALSDGDHRTPRRMRIRGHLRACAGCRDFETAMRQRPAQLAATIPPLPVAGAAAILHTILGGPGTHGGGGLAAGFAGTAKASTAFSLAAKAATVMAVGATLAGGAVYAVPALDPGRPAHPAAGSVAATSTASATRSALGAPGQPHGSRAITATRRSTRSVAPPPGTASTIAATPTGAPVSSPLAPPGPPLSIPGSGGAAPHGPPASAPGSSVAGRHGPRAGTPGSGAAGGHLPRAGTPASGAAGQTVPGPPTGTPGRGAAIVNTGPTDLAGSSAHVVAVGTPGFGAVGSTGRRPVGGARAPTRR